ncbi:MAG TPA: hypothetical protein VFQ65_06475 [Kofleriaceae bacterium]|nr:hypothetical protein [Kofleriaceae bacterium]
MRTLFALVLVASLGILGSGARAEDAAGSYDVKFDEMGHNCNPPPVALGRSKLNIATRKNSLVVNIDTIPEMAGVPQKGGKVNAKTVKGAVPTTVQGLDAKYSIAGKIDDGGMLQLVLVAEYIKHDDKKPYCTQSWNVTGLRGTPDKPEKK